MTQSMNLNDVKYLALHFGIPLKSRKPAKCKGKDTLYNEIVAKARERFCEHQRKQEEVKLKQEEEKLKEEERRMEKEERRMAREENDKDKKDIFSMIYQTNASISQTNASIQETNANALQSAINFDNFQSYQLRKNLETDEKISNIVEMLDEDLGERKRDAIKTAQQISELQRQVSAMTTAPNIRNSRQGHY